MKIFQKLKWDTLKHAHPWKVVQYDTPKVVTIECFHSIFVTPFIYGTNIVLIYFFKQEPKVLSKTKKLSIGHFFFIKGTFSSSFDFKLFFPSSLSVNFNLTLEVSKPSNFNFDTFSNLV